MMYRCLKEDLIYFENCVDFTKKKKKSIVNAKKYSERWQFTVVLRAVIYRQVIGQSFLKIQQVILTYINNTIRTHNQHNHHNQPNQKHNGTGNEVMWDDVNSE